jgi:parallel beta-helix repeat protein
VNKTRIAALLAAGTAMAVAPVLASAPAQAAPRHTTLYVSAGARANHASNRSCGSAAFRSIGAAVAAARPGATIVVCAGTYHEDVAVTKALTIEGRRGATVDATKKNNGFAITAPNVTVTGLTIRNAIGEGILSTADRTTITHNVVENNDLGGLPKNPVPNDYAECKATAGVPGDCGEGIHLMGSSHSTVADNISRHNSGGILISDEGHPASYNRIAGNTVTDNLFDCGITVVSHNPAGAKTVHGAKANKFTKVTVPVFTH